MASSMRLGEQLEAFISRAVATGRYGSRSDVLREGVRLVQERELLFARATAELEQGLADLDEGRSTPADKAFDELDAFIDSIENGERRSRA